MRALLSHAPGGPETLRLDELPDPQPGHAHLPADVRPWRDLWSAGQGIDLIEDIPTVAELVSRLRREYIAACETPDMAKAAMLAEAALAPAAGR